MGIMQRWLEGRNSVASERLRTTYAIPPSRRGRRAITTWQKEAAIWQLKAIALEQGWTQEHAFAEALNLLFAKHGKATIP
jgi:hypothetical protein